MEKKQETFTYTYSARQQEEVQRIRKKYLPPEEDKMEQLRRLDRRATQKSQAWAIGLGFIGALVLGTGMSLAMTNLSGFPDGTAMLIGIPVGVIGMALAALAYPVFLRTLKKERQRIAPEILRLSDELMK